MIQFARDMAWRQALSREHHKRSSKSENRVTNQPPLKSSAGAKRKGKCKAKRAADSSKSIFRGSFLFLGRLFGYSLTSDEDRIDGLTLEKEGGK